MRQKRFLAVLLAATLALGSSVTAFAGTVSSGDVTKDPATGTMTGKSNLEGLVDTDVFIVEVPTIPTKSPLDFIMDPQNLIEQTGGAKYATSNTNMDKRNGISTDNISYNSLYFTNMTSANTVSGLSASSDALMIKNKGTNDVTVKMDAKVTQLGNISMSTNSNVSQNTAPTLYLALTGEDVSGNNAQTAAVSKTEDDNLASISTRISGCDAAYEVSVNSANEYGYKLSSNDVDFDGYAFKLTGTCGGGAYADWATIGKTMEKTPVKVDVTWNITTYVDPVAPSLGSSTIAKPTEANKAAFVDIDFGAGALAAKGIKSITFVDGSDTKTLAADAYEVVNGQLKIKATHLTYVTATRVYTIHFDDAAKSTSTDRKSVV